MTIPSKSLSVFSTAGWRRRSDAREPGAAEDMTAAMLSVSLTPLLIRSGP